MRNAATRLVGPTLVVGAVAAIWVAVGLGPLATPQTAQVATARDVASTPKAHPSAAVVLAVRHAGDRVLIRVRSGSTTTDLEVSPSARMTGTSLVQLAEAAATGTPQSVRFEYGAEGVVRAITHA